MLGSSLMSGSSARTLAIVLLIVGLILVVIGVVYLTVPADKLPSLLGHLPHATNHRTKRGGAALALGAVGLVASGVLFSRSRRRSA
jgi:hypothetical protein